MNKFEDFKIGDVVYSNSAFPGKLNEGGKYTIVELCPAVPYPDNTGSWEPTITVIGDNNKPVTAHYYRFRKV